MNWRRSAVAGETPNVSLSAMSELTHARHMVETRFQIEADIDRDAGDDVVFPN